MKTRKIIPVIFCAVLTTACQNKTTQDNTVLLNKDFQVSESIKRDFTNATEKDYNSEESFDNIGATFNINVKTLEKDSLHSIIKNITVTLLKGVKSYEFNSVTNGQQVNHGAETSSIVTVGYYTEKNLGKESVNKVFTITSKGNVTEIK